MSKFANLAAGIIFAIVAGVCLYRLLFWFPITVGGQQVGQAATFLALAISVALAMVFLKGGIARSEG